MARLYAAMMLIFAVLVLVGALVSCGHSKPPVMPPVKPPSPLATLTWERNSEEDMQDYLIYFCWDGEDCRPHEKPRGPVKQTPVGVKPSFKIDLTGSVGAVAITARDTYGNESLLSNIVRFDRRN